jgi:hypothetical protein
MPGVLDNSNLPFDPMQSTTKWRSVANGKSSARCVGARFKKRRKLKKKVVAGTVHRGGGSVHVPELCSFAYCKYSAVTVSD